MKSLRYSLSLFLAVALFGCVLNAQSQAPSQTVTAAVPRQVNFSGRAVDAQGKPMAGIAGVTFEIYKDQYAGAPLWMETQNVQADAQGNYTVQLGATKSEGLPLELFSSGEARWLGVRVNGGEEQARVFLLSVPYALKAADAETVGGLPASAFVLAAPSASMTSTVVPNVTPTTASLQQPLTGTTPVTTAGGTVNKLAKFDGTADIANSQVFDNGTSVGIGNTAPAAKLDVSGTGIFRGTLSLPATGTANATAGKNSQPFNFTASAFNSGTAKAVNETFRWQAEPTGNDTTTPLGKLNLLFGSGTATPAETGLSISNQGAITFASGQTFPASVGTVTSVALSAPSSDFTVSGSPVTTSGTLGLNWNVAPTNAGTANAIVKRDATGSFTAGAIIANLGMLGETTTASGNGVAGINNGGGIAVYGAGDTGVGVWGQSSGAGPVSDGVHGVTSSGAGSGVAGVNNSGAIGGVGVYGTGGIGVYGISDGAQGNAGTYGQIGSTQSVLGQGSGGSLVGVWGDGGPAFTGVFGTADGGSAGAFYNNSSGLSALFADNLDPSGMPFYAWNGATSGYCNIDSGGNLNCSGTKNAVVPIDSGKRKVALSAIESPKNWFEDAGAAQLVSGSAAVTLDPDFIQTVNTELEYHVFLTPKGDCKGLYISQQTPSSFEVRELGDGTSSIRFDYRVMALRKNYENVRFADHTNDPDPRKMMERTKGARPQTKPGPIPARISELLHPAPDQLQPDK
jgi:hypothetical protein